RLPGLQALHLIRVRVADPEHVVERLPARAPVGEPGVRAARPEIDARLLDARVPAVLRVVAAERAEAHVVFRQREEEARVLDLVRHRGRRGAVARADPLLDLRLELHRLGLRGTGGAETERGDLAVDRELLEEERELPALVDLDGVLEVCPWGPAC